MNIQHALRYASEHLIPVTHNQHDARREAEWLLSHYTHLSLGELLLQQEQELNSSVEQQFINAIQERCRDRKPLAYIIGWVPFCGLTIQVRPPILIPRHETEEWVDALIQRIPEDTPLVIADICTGSGCIALAIAYHRPAVTVIGVDINHDALTLARENQTALGISNVSFIYSDLFNNLQGHTFDLIISNPPYLSRTEWEQLPPDVQQWESAQALISDNGSGTDIYRKILQDAPSYLKQDPTDILPLPHIVLEYGATQAAAITTLLTAYGFSNQEHATDLFGNPRSVIARYTQI